MDRFRQQLAASYGPRCLVHSSPECDAVIREQTPQFTSLYSVLTNTPNNTEVPVDKTKKVFDGRRKGGSGICYVTRETVGERQRKQKTFEELRDDIESGRDYLFEQGDGAGEVEGIGGVVGKVVGLWVGEVDLVEKVEGYLGEGGKENGGGVGECVKVLVVGRKGVGFDESRRRGFVDRRYKGGRKENGKDEGVGENGVVEGGEVGMGEEERLRMVVIGKDWNGGDIRSVVTGWVQNWLQSRIKRVRRRVDSRRQTLKTAWKSLWNVYTGATQKHETKDQEMNAGDLTQSPTAPLAREWTGGMVNGISLNSKVKKLDSEKRDGEESSTESLTQELADLQFANKDYQNALINYRLLQHDFRSLPDQDIIHHLSLAHSLRMGAISLLMLERSRPREVGSMFDEAIRSYNQAKKRNSALQTAALFHRYCLAVGFPDSAAGVLLRSLTTIYPHLSQNLLRPSSDYQAELVCGTLLAKVADALAEAGRSRRAALYAYYASEKLANVDAQKASTRAAMDIGRRFEGGVDAWTSIDLFLGIKFGELDLRMGRAEKAFRQFKEMLEMERVVRNVPLQKLVLNGFLKAVRMMRKEAADVENDKKMKLLDTRFPPVWDNSPLTVETADSEYDATKCDMLSEQKPSMRETSSKSQDEELQISLLRQIQKAALERNEDFTNKMEEKVERLTIGDSAETKADETRPISDERDNNDDSEWIQALRTESSSYNNAYPDEDIAFRVSVFNPLACPVYLADIEAVTSFEPDVSQNLSPPLASVENPETNDLESAGIEKNEGKVEDQVSDAVESFTQKPLMIPPRGKAMLSLRERAIQSGILTITGAKWKFACSEDAISAPSEFIPGYTKLVKRRKRLNRTRKERASSVPLYAPEEGFRIRIIQPAPRLKASWSIEEQLDLLAGEVVRTEITVENISAVADVSLVETLWYRLSNSNHLSMNTKSLRIVRKDNSKDDLLQENGGMNGCCGHIGDDGQFTDLGLRQGDKLIIPLVIRTPQIDSSLHGTLHAYKKLMETDVTVAFAYHPESARFLKLRTRLRAKPSLSACICLIRSKANSTSNTEKLIGIRVKCDSTGTQGSFYITSVSLSSNDGYELRELQINDEAQSQFSLDSPGASALIFVACGSASGSTEMTRRSRVELGRRKMSVDCMDNEENLLDNGSNEALSLLGVGNITLRWNCDSAGGVTPAYPDPSSKWNSRPLVPGEPPTSKQNKPNGIEVNNDKSIYITVEHSEMVSHNFTTGPCVIPVMVIVQNTRRDVASVRVRCVNEEIADGCRGRCWIGHRDYHILHLSAGSFHKTHMQAAVEKPGNYNVGAFVATVDGSNETCCCEESYVEVLQRVVANGHCEKDKKGMGPEMNNANGIKAASPERRGALGNYKRTNDGFDERMGNGMAKVSAILAKEDDGVWDAADTDDEKEEGDQLV